jgi:hypothetical protein
LAYRISVVDAQSLAVIHDSPDYGHLEIPVRTATIEGDVLTVDIGHL